jgi:hypothetical protein
MEFVTQYVLPHWPFVAAMFIFMMVGQVMKTAVFTKNAHLKNTHINEKMRAILIDWLVDVHLKFKMVPESLYLTVNLIDRYLAVKTVRRSKLQLVGVHADAVSLRLRRDQKLWASPSEYSAFRLKVCDSSPPRRVASA